MLSRQACGGTQSALLSVPHHCRHDAASGATATPVLSCPVHDCMHSEAKMHALLAQIYLAR